MLNSTMQKSHQTAEIQYVGRIGKQQILASALKKKKHVCGSQVDHFFFTTQCMIDYNYSRTEGTLANS